MDKQEEIITQLKIILEIFLRENFVSTNDVYFEKLITHLKEKENAFIFQAPFALDWVDKCVTLIDDGFNKVHPKVISFMLNFCSFLTMNEWVLINLKERQIITRIMAIMARDGHLFNPSIKLGFIRFLVAISGYSIGLLYLRSVRAWSVLIQYSNKDHTLYVVREARQLLYDLLYKFSVKVHDDAIVLEILAEIIQPIHENVFSGNEDHITINVDDNEMFYKLSSTLDLLSYIFQQTLESEEKIYLAKLCKEHHNLDFNLWKLSEMTHNKFFFEKIFTTMTSYFFAHLSYEKLNAQNVENFNDFGLGFFNTMKFCVQRGDCLTFLKLAELNHVLWKKLGSRAPKEIMIENQCVVFENQLICFHMLPLLFSIKVNENNVDEEIFDNYVMKLLEISCEQTLRICYAYRDTLFTPEGSTSSYFTADLAQKCIYSILAMENILERDQAVLVCQAMLYILKEFVRLDSLSNQIEVEGISSESGYSKLFPRGTELIVVNPKVLHAVMVGLQKLIERYKITWKESIETICLVNCVAYVLENQNFDARCTVQALKLVQLSIERFLSPNMALLVDNLQGSGLLCLGPIIVKRFHDSAWEVRDSTLELVTSIADISRMKFPAFQGFLIEYKISPIVYQMAKNDCQPYVRASAFTCLTKLVSINKIWEMDLSQLDLIEHIFFVLYNESEGIVRKEALQTLGVIFNKGKILPKYINTLFSTVNHCVVADLHWEVKIQALHFWKMEFQKQFTNQGMIDGIFPTVTFSKELKKIVTLTEREVKLRIAKVFLEVSNYGYFGILLKCLHDECDLEVLKYVVSGVRVMIEKLDKYAIESTVDELEALSNNAAVASNSYNNCITPKTLTPPPSVEEPQSIENADEVIDSIIATQDINLLESAFNTQMFLDQMEVVEIPHINEYFYKQYSTVTVKEFFKAVRQLDLDAILLQHHEWFLCAESLTSLLDDIMLALKNSDETIISDCY